jgi:zinc finger HIT domain-containing protein 3
MDPWLIIVRVGDEITEEVPLRPLTSLKWPYVPDESAYPDPLKRDDPKPLQTAQYEAIGSQNLLSFISSGSP